MNTARLQSWYAMANDCMVGLTYDHTHPKYAHRDGTEITTSTVMGKNRGRVVTRNTIYTLGDHRVEVDRKAAAASYLSSLAHINLAALTRRRAAEALAR